jgi:hypothetical protein
VSGVIHSQRGRLPDRVDPLGARGLAPTTTDRRGLVVRGGLPHAFMVVSKTCRLLCLHAPATCEDFYFGASEPLEGSAREVDFGRIAGSAQTHGGMTVVGPPPFA